MPMLHGETFLLGSRSKKITTGGKAMNHILFGWIVFFSVWAGVILLVAMFLKIGYYFSENREAKIYTLEGCIEKIEEMEKMCREALSK